MSQPPTEEDIQWARHEAEGKEPQAFDQTLKKEVWENYINKSYHLICKSCAYGKVLAFVPVGTDPVPWDLWSRILQIFGHTEPAWRIIFFASPAKRLLPAPGQPIGPPNVNGGYCYRCQPATIVVYREEEATRVLLHELFHAACTDRELPLPEMEAETETWAELALIAMLSGGSERKAKQLLAKQIKWVADTEKTLEARHTITGPQDYVWRYTVGRETAFRRLGIELPKGRIHSSQSLRLTIL